MSIHKKTFNDKGEKFCCKCKAYHPVLAFYKSGYVCTATFRAFSGIKIEDKTKMEIPIPDKDFVDNAVKLLRFQLPDLKLANPYIYQRPDAYDIYMEDKRTNTNPTIL